MNGLVVFAPSPDSSTTTFSTPGWAGPDVFAGSGRDLRELRGIAGELLQFATSGSEGHSGEDEGGGCESCGQPR
ncbi:MAG: hypothetical protein M3O70_02705 [Actinomycetota bacterium]|nr:hypothetical protein [Actinomycetota bacterium]